MIHCNDMLSALIVHVQRDQEVRAAFLDWFIEEEFDAELADSIQVLREEVARYKSERVMG